MQLIVDADNIDIQRNMSTVEQEPLNEKFLTDKVITHLADDITTGNKENIQKQENIIVPNDDNVVDAGKEITGTDDVLTDNLNDEKLNQDSVHTENVHDEEVKEDENTKNHQEKGNILTQESIVNEESQVQENETKLEKLNNTDVTVTEPIKGDYTDEVRVDENVTAEDTETVKEIDNKEIPTEEENKIILNKEIDISELSTELNEEKISDLNKVVNIADNFTELSEGHNTITNTVETDPEKTLEKQSDIEIEDVDADPEKKLDNDIEMDTVDTALENKLEKENDVEMNTVYTVPEKVVEKESIQTEITNTGLEDTLETEDTELESGHMDNIIEKNTAIEIDDEDEKICEKSAESDQQVQEVLGNLEKTEDAELIEDLDKSVQEDSAAKVSKEPEQPKRICRLSNNLDIFSDEEDDVPDVESSKEIVQPLAEKQYINIDDDDDIMLIDEDSSLKKGTSIEVADTNSANEKILENVTLPDDKNNTCKDDKEVTDIIEETVLSEAENKDTVSPTNDTSDMPVTETNKVAVDKLEETEIPKKPLLPRNFLDTCKKNLSDMTRNGLEEFCILKIVESIVDRSNLGEIKAHLKNLTRTMEECKKKCFMLSKQNKDLQVVLKSVQEEQKMGSDVHITPLKITRSVGMQVVMMADKGNTNNTRKKITNGVSSPVPVVPINNAKQIRNQIPNPRNQKDKASINQQIPVPRLVPATPPAAKINQSNTNSTATKQVNNTALPNGMRNSPPVQKVAEKRGRSQAVTVDLTDDEPPTKLQNVQRGPVNQPMRVLTTAPNLIPAQRFTQNINSPRKVFIPISAPQAQNVRPGQTIMLKTLPGLGPRQRAPTQALISKTGQNSNQVRFGRGQLNRHPAPLPDAMKQYQPPNWKSLPPAPDLKLSKVENGIVISWKIDGYEEENHEEIASYQLYAYQETSSPPNTALWKKIGDVKALPLPMACTLTQFMAGYKYYFAVRAVDIRSRFGPFSLPGSILLLNKM